MSLFESIKKALPFKIERNSQPRSRGQWGWLYPYIRGMGVSERPVKPGWNTYYQAMDNEVVSSCIDAFIVETIAAGFKIYSDKPELDNLDVVDYATELFKYPHGKGGAENFTNFIWKGLSSYLGPGDWFAEVVHDDIIRGLPVGFYFIQPHRMEYYFDTDQWGLRNTSIRYENDELIHVIMPDVRNELWGKSLIDKAAKSITMDVLGLNFNHDYFEDGLSPKNFVEFDADIPQEVYDNAVDDMIAQSRKNPRGTYFLQGGRFKEGSSTNRDMEFTTLLNMMRDRVIMTYGVPPKVVGVKTQGQIGGKGDSEEDAKLFKKRIKGKVFNIVEAEFNRVLGNSFDMWGFDERFHFGDIDSDDMEKRARIENIRLRNGSSYINEVRAGYGQDPVEWGNTPLTYATGIMPNQTVANDKVLNRNVGNVKSLLEREGYIKKA